MGLCLVPAVVAVVVVVVGGGGGGGGGVGVGVVVVCDRFFFTLRVATFCSAVEVYILHSSCHG